MDEETIVRGPLLTAWWATTVDTWIHIEELLREPERRLLLPLLDQLLLEIELEKAGA